MSHVPCHPASPAAHLPLLFLLHNVLRRINARQKALIAPKIIPLTKVAAGIDVF